MKSRFPLPEAVSTEVWSRIRSAGRIALFLDFDGTLAPIVREPSQARLTSDISRSLQILAADPWIATSIVSGRALDDIETRIGVNGFIYAGNHGLEIAGPGFHFIEPHALRSRTSIAATCASLSRRLSRIPGVLVENKGFSASVHYRMTRPADEPAVRIAVTSAAGEDFRIRQGKKVLEILPRTDWNKGSAASWILQKLQSPGLLPICFGDDVTDEDLFRALPDGVTVKVGDSMPSAALYTVRGTNEVGEFLHQLAQHGLERQRGLRECSH